MNFLARHLAICLSLSLLSLSCHAITGNEQVELAGGGRFEELWQRLERHAAGNRLKTADLHALCFAYSKTKRYNKLMPCLDRLEAGILQGDTRTRLFGLDDATPTVYLMRSEAMVELGQYAQAIAQAQLALDWFKQNASDDKDIQINALTVQSLASTFAGKTADGEKYAQEMERINTSWPLSSDFKSIKAMALARVYMALGKFDRTFEAISGDTTFAVHAFLDKLVSGAFLTGKNNWAWQELPRSFMLNKALFGMGRTKEAREGYDKLLAIPQVRDNGEIYWLMLNDRGRIAESEGKLDEAIQFYKKAIEVIEGQRATINTEASKIGFVGDKQQVYGRIVSALIAHRQPELALEYIERSKSRALVDILASKQNFVVPDSIRPQAATLLKEYEAAQNEVVAQMPVSATEGKSTQRSQSARAIQQVQAIAPELGSLIAVSSVSTQELQGLLEADETMIQFYYEGRDFYATLLGRSSLATVKLEIDGLEQDIRQFREAIENLDNQAIPLAQRLYRRLIHPLTPHLAGKNLLIVPHGLLHYLPFAALHDEKNYLIDQYALRILPSASVLKYLKPKRATVPGSLLVFGNPDLGDSKLDLPDAQVEAEKVAGTAKQAKLLLRRQASETAFKENSEKFHYIHIASHGKFDSGAPLQSALMLAKDDKNDGMLTVSELYSLQLGADLVTLSACETGLGKINSGDDVVGLTRGFFYSGARSVIASLWQVDDEATSYLMIQLYAALAKQNKRDALRTALLETKKRYAHPFYWAAFSMTGSVQ